MTPSESTHDSSSNWRERLKAVPILVVGDVMLDRYWFGDVERISPEAPVPVVRIGSQDERLGGAANVARNLAALGGQASLLGTVGDDEPGRHVRALLGAAGINDHVVIDASNPTTVKLRVIGRGQQLLRVDFEQPPSPTALSSKLDRCRALLPQQKALVLSDYGKGGLSDIGTMIAAGREAGMPVLVDPKGDDFSKYAGASYLTPNRSELRAVIGRWDSEQSLTERAQNLRRSLNLQALLLTRSEEGMTLFDDDGAFHVPAQAREVFDVSGAGDTVIATLALMLAAGADAKLATMVANHAGGIVVGKLGTATVTAQELFG